MSSAVDDIEVVERAGDFVLVRWRNVILNVWDGRVSVARLRQLKAAGPRVVKKYGLRGVNLSVVTANTALVSVGGAERAMASEVARDQAEFLCASACVIEGDGFLGATLRGITASVSLLARAPYPFRVFGSVRDCAPWLAPHVAPPRVSTSQLFEMIGEMRRDDFAP